MKKITLIIIPFLLLIISNAYGFYYTFGIEDIPIQLITADISNNPYGGLINIANASADLYLSDNLSLKFRFKDVFMNAPPAGVTNTNYFYADRLSVEYNGENFGALVGRDLYLENNGILIGNMADGARLSANFLGLKERIYAYDSGIPGTMPTGVNQFYIQSVDSVLSNGPQRFVAGGVVEALGLLNKSVSGTILYSMDLSTNKLFNPLYIGLNAEGTIIPSLTFTIAGIYELGSYDTNISLSGWAIDAGLQYLTGDDIKFGLTGELAIASGDNTNSTNVYEGFKAYGKYSTGLVEGLDFSNLFLIRVGIISRLFEDHLSLKIDYIYSIRMSTNNESDIVSMNSYSSNGQVVGNEVDGTLNWDFDPNISLFANIGYFIPGNAYISTTNQYKLLAGISLKI